MLTSSVRNIFANYELCDTLLSNNARSSRALVDNLFSSKNRNDLIPLFLKALRNNFSKTCAFEIALRYKSAYKKYKVECKERHAVIIAKGPESLSKKVKEKSRVFFDFLKKEQKDKLLYEGCFSAEEEVEVEEVDLEEIRNRDTKIHGSLVDLDRPLISNIISFLDLQAILNLLGFLSLENKTDLLASNLDFFSELLRRNVIVQLKRSHIDFNLKRNTIGQTTNGQRSIHLAKHSTLRHTNSLTRHHERDFHVDRLVEFHFHKIDVLEIPANGVIAVIANHGEDRLPARIELDDGILPVLSL